MYRSLYIERNLDWGVGVVLARQMENANSKPSGEARNTFCKNLFYCSVLLKSQDTLLFLSCNLIACVRPILLRRKEYTHAYRINALSFETS